MHGVSGVSRAEKLLKQAIRFKVDPCDLIWLLLYTSVGLVLTGDS